MKWAPSAQMAKDMELRRTKSAAIDWLLHERKELCFFVTCWVPVDVPSRPTSGGPSIGRGPPFAVGELNSGTDAHFGSQSFVAQQFRVGALRNVAWAEPLSF